MKILVLVFLLIGTTLFAQVRRSWSHGFIGSINQIRSIDIDGNQQKDIIIGGEGGTMAIKDDGSLLWSTIDTLTVSSLFPIQYDSDANPEFAVAGWMHIEILDDNGSQLALQTLNTFATAKLPITLLNHKIVSFYQDSYDFTNNGLVFFGEYMPFYKISSVGSNGLASADTDNDSIKDTLFVIGGNDNNLSKLDKNGNPIWTHLLTYDNPSYLWAGTLQNNQPVLLIGTSDGAIHAYDMDGTELWSQSLPSNLEVKEIKKDEDGGILVVTNNSSLWTSTITNILFKLDENNGSVLWQYASDANVTRALAQHDSLIAAGFNSGIKIFDENGTILHEVNLSLPSYDNYLDVHSLQFGSLGVKEGLFVGTLDIDLFNDTSHEKIYSGGTLIQKVSSADMNGDGKDEIVAQDEHRLYLYSDTGALLWTKEHYVLFDSIHFADLTGDGKKELIAGHDGKVVILNYKGDTLWSKTGYYSNIYPHIDLYDYDGDGLKDIFLSILDYDTQKYTIEVWRGKDAALLHTFGSTDNVSLVKVLSINGIKKLYYSEYNSIYSIDFNATTASQEYESISLSYDNKLNDFKDINHDGVVDVITAQNSDATSLVINRFDFTQKDEYGQVKYNSTTISSPDYAKMIKFYDYNSDGVYELLVIFPQGVYLYDLNGTQIWKEEISDEFGENRMLSDIKIVNNLLFVSGKEIYVLNNNGKEIQQIKPPNYMSPQNYYLPTTLAKTSVANLQLVVGAMGISSYTGISLDTSKLEKLPYKAGWSLVATPLNQTISLTAIPNLSIAWSYQRGKWSVHTTNQTDRLSTEALGISQFDAIIPTQGVWIRTLSDGELSLSGEANSVASLTQGWNLVGGTTTTPDILHNQNKNIDIIWRYTNQAKWEGKSYISGISLDTLTNIQATDGLWVHVK